MRQYFNINLEFDKQIVDKTIKDTIASKGKGYVCVVESNNLTVANNNEAFRKVINDGLVNICDGSVLSIFLAKIHKQHLQPYLGANLFSEYIAEKKYNQYFIGNTREVLNGLKHNLIDKDPNIENMVFAELPFKKVDEFDYPAIAEDINKHKPDIIWVSLGAPKQEFFMANLLPHLDHGVMFGVGAVFNFNAGVGHVKRAPKWMRKCKLEWLYRAFEEPKKNIPRYLNFIKILPSLILQERRAAKQI